MIQQSLLFMLAVDVQQERRELAQSRHSAGLVVDVHAVAYVRRYFTADNELMVLHTLGVQAEPVEFDMQVRFEDGFDNRATLSGADHFRRRFRSCQECEGVNDDGFAGAGFARQEIKTFLEMKFEMIDEGEV